MHKAATLSSTCLSSRNHVLMCARTFRVKCMEEILRELRRTGVSSVNVFTYALGRKWSSKAHGSYGKF